MKKSAVKNVEAFEARHSDGEKKKLQFYKSVSAND